MQQRRQISHTRGTPIGRIQRESGAASVQPHLVAPSQSLAYHHIGQRARRGLLHTALPPGADSDFESVMNHVGRARC
jgi:hypothetical protein